MLCLPDPHHRAAVRVILCICEALPVRRRHPCAALLLQSLPVAARHRACFGKASAACLLPATPELTARHSQRASQTHPVHYARFELAVQVCLPASRACQVSLMPWSTGVRALLPARAAEPSHGPAVRSRHGQVCAVLRAVPSPTAVQANRSGCVPLMSLTPPPALSFTDKRT